MSAIVINSTDSLQRVFGELREMFGKHKFLRLNVKTGKDRSLDQNAISHVWYEQLSRELPEEDALGWKCFCKLYFGVPLMRAEDEEFREFYDAAIKKSLTHEQKLAAMKYLPVTSHMTTAQLSKYLEAMQQHFIKHGVMLEFPEGK
ncbi:hypothetical protein [Herbaspirillum sp. ST 5-3]|uniref:hypothetical protein n=1 Tax=Oxalobacteraceae TaxID=75682 RepID=UPI0010A3BE21|nr:hypothetical protein [Herbaspirillum sp. ST 5-3]